MSAVRTPPAAIDAERQVLGAALIAPDAWLSVADTLRAESFFLHKHRLLFDVLDRLSEAGEPFDPVTITERLRLDGHEEEVGGREYLEELIANTPGPANVAQYAEVVAERAQLRGLIEVGTRITTRAFQPGTRTSQEVIEEAEIQMSALADRQNRIQTGPRLIRTVAREAFRELQNRWENRGQPMGLQTGLTDLDALLVGLQPEDLVILAARPAMGKTSLALSIAYHAAVAQKRSVAILSMEMSTAQLALRQIAARARIDSNRLRTGRINDDDWAAVASALAEMVEAPIFIDDTPALSPTELRMRVRRQHRQQPLGLVVVDYLQLMTASGNNDTRAAEVGEISRSLKALAKELHVPVIALSQLNRSLEQRANKRPVLADLRESGAIEQDADVVAFIYRDDYYNQDSPHPGVAEIIVAKARSGPTGTVYVRFDAPFTTFSDLPPEQRPQGLDAAG